MKKTRAMVAIVILAAVAGTGCVTKKVFRKNVEETNARIQGVETGVEENERRVAELGTQTDEKITAVRSTAEKAQAIGTQALQQAEEAEKLARGKMLWEVTLSDDRVKFGFNQAQLPSEATAVLDELVQRVRQMDHAVYMEIEGHTDQVGSEEYNFQLGRERAEAIRGYLASQGIPLHAMEVISYGEVKPVASNSNRDGRSQNRRVVIRVLE